LREKRQRTKGGTYSERKRVPGPEVNISRGGGALQTTSKNFGSATGGRVKKALSWGVEKGGEVLKVESKPLKVRVD